VSDPSEQPRLKVGESPKPILWHVVAMFVVLPLGPLLTVLVGAEPPVNRVLISVGLALVSLSLARWHYAHRADGPAGELSYHRLALVFLTIFGGFGWMFASSVVSGALLVWTFLDRTEPDKHRPLSRF
jgi:hypothetical protein